MCYVYSNASTPHPHDRCPACLSAANAPFEFSAASTLPSPDADSVIRDPLDSDAVDSDAVDGDAFEDALELDADATDDDDDDDDDSSADAAGADALCGVSLPFMIS